MTRTFAPHELAAQTWFSLSPFKSERAIAARRYRELAGRPGLTGDIVIDAIGSIAVDRMHAIAITERILTDRVDAIRRRVGDPDAARFVRSTIDSILAAWRAA